jgi:uncharacterized protein (DUF427 family)
MADQGYAWPPMARLAPNGLPEEAVWDYPRPPALEPCGRRARVVLGGEVIADSARALRVLETASPPTIYVPAADVATESLEPARAHQTFCEWKGAASHFHVRGGGSVAEHAAWAYREPRAPFSRLRGHFAFYPGRVDACYLDDERVTPQPGGFYGGWVTAEIVGPYKGDPGTEGW